MIHDKRESRDKRESSMMEDKRVDAREDAATAAYAHHEPTLKRNISAIAIIGLGLSICNGWAAMSSTIVIGLGQGGTPVILYGLIGTSIINVFIAATLAELSAAYPSAGGQYVWSSILAPTRWRKSISFFVGWATIFEWVTIVASVVIISAEVIYGLVTTYHPGFEVQRWHVFLIFLAVNTIASANNLFVLNKLPNIGTMFLIFSSLIYLAILITCPAAAKTHQPNKFVWATYSNDMGWSSAFVVVSTGLVNPSYVYAGIDGAVHIAEDCLDPARSVPFALASTVGMGLFTGFTFSVALLYSIQDVHKAATAELPFLEIIVQATRSRACGAVFMTAFLCVLMVSSNSVHQASSRLIWSFARDGGLPFARHVAHVHPRLRVPVIPIILSWFGVTVLGVLYIASHTVYGSIIACCILLGNISYAILAVQLLMGGRHMNPHRWLKLGWFGALSNVIVILWTLFTTVLWLFPSTPHPTGSTMNYSVVVLVVMFLLALVDWFVYGRKHFEGPSEAPLALASVASSEAHS